MKGLMVVGALALVLAGAGCGSGSSSTTDSSPTPSQGIGGGLHAAGLQRCIGPVSGRGDTSTPVGAVGPVSLSLYAEPGLAAIVASGSSAEQHAIDLAMLRNHVQTSVSQSAVAGTERAWRHEALGALRHSHPPAGPCGPRLARLPVLAATEVVCADELLIPLGHPPAMHQFIDVLSKLVSVKFTPEQFTYLSRGQYLTTPESTTVSRPYCQS